MRRSDSLLLIFVKHPVAGKAKTRLAAGIGATKALAVYRDLLRYTRDLALELDLEAAVFYGNEIPDSDLWSEAGFSRFPQQGADLGARMAHAFRWAFAQGFRRVCIIGSDCARLTGAIVQVGFDLLSHHDAVIGPATDGGYYLLGLRSMFEPVFRHKAWSTDRVLADTRADLDRAGKSYQLLPELSDIDVKEDLSGTFLEPYLKES